MFTWKSLLLGEKPSLKAARQQDGWDICGWTVINMISFTYEAHSLFLFCFIVTVLNVIILLGDEEITQSARFTVTKLK